MITVFIEAVAGSREKHAYNEETLEYRGKGETLLPYPYPYGFITGTRTPEGDGVDCYVLTDRKLEAGTSVECEPKGMLEFFEGDERDHKVLATIPGENRPIDDALRLRLEAFIYGIFAQFPEMTVRVGEIRPEDEARAFIDRWRLPG